MVGLKANRALAELKVLELVRVLLDDPAWVERAMIRGRAHPDEHTSIEPETDEAVADALLNARSRGVNELSQPLKRGSLAGAQSGKVRGNRLRL